MADKPSASPFTGVLRWTWAKTRGHLRGLVGAGFGVPLTVGVLGGVFPLTTNPSFGDRVANGVLLLLVGFAFVGICIAVFVLLIAPYQQRNALRVIAGQQAGEIRVLGEHKVDQDALKEHLRHLQTWAASQDDPLSNNDPLDLGVTPAVAFAKHFADAFVLLVEYNASIKERAEAWDAIALKAMEAADTRLNSNAWHVYDWAARSVYTGWRPIRDDSVAVAMTGAVIGQVQGGASIVIHEPIDDADEAERLAREVLADLKTVARWDEIPQVRDADKAIEASRRAAQEALEPVPWQTTIQYQKDCPACPHPGGHA